MEYIYIYIYIYDFKRRPIWPSYVTILFFNVVNVTIFVLFLLLMVPISRRLVPLLFREKIYVWEISRIILLFTYSLETTYYCAVNKLSTNLMTSSELLYLSSQTPFICSLFLFVFLLTSSFSFTKYISPFFKNLFCPESREMVICRDWIFHVKSNTSEGINLEVELTKDRMELVKKAKQCTKF